VDSAFSLEPSEFALLRHETKQAWQSLGKVQNGPTKSEILSLRYRRSIYVSQDVKAGDAVTAENIRIVRPSLGMLPKFYEEVLALRFSKSAKKGTPLSFDLLTSK
jgi:N-acetylneuraminate synthase